MSPTIAVRSLSWVCRRINWRIPFPSRYRKGAYDCQRVRQEGRASENVSMVLLPDLWMNECGRQKKSEAVVYGEDSIFARRIKLFLVNEEEEVEGWWWWCSVREMSWYFWGFTIPFTHQPVSQSASDCQQCGGRDWWAVTGDDDDRRSGKLVRQ